MRFRRFVEEALTRSAEAVVKVSNTVRTGWMLATRDEDFRLPELAPEG